MSSLRQLNPAEPVRYLKGDHIGKAVVERHDMAGCVAMRSQRKPGLTIIAARFDVFPDDEIERLPKRVEEMTNSLRYWAKCAVEEVATKNSLASA